MCRALHFPSWAEVRDRFIRSCRFIDITARQLLAEQVLLSGCQVSCGRRQGPMNYNLEAGFGRRSYRVTTRGLMIAFAVGWGLFSILLLLQDHAIDAQRELIQLLMQDLHTALTSSHGNSGSMPVVVHKVELPSSTVQMKSAPSPDVQLRPLEPKVQPKTEGSTRNPSSQGKSQSANRGRGSRQAKEQLPVKPPAQFTDPSDMRRVTFSI